MSLNKILKLHRDNFKNNGIRVFSDGPRRFRVSYSKNTPIPSYISVVHKPDKLTAKLNSGFTHPKHRGKGLGTLLRAIAMRLLYLAGYKRVKHQGVNIEHLVGPNQYPISTSIVRKHLGFKPGNINEPNEPNNIYARTHSPRGPTGYNSTWKRKNRSSVLKLKRTIAKARTILRSAKRT